MKHKLTGFGALLLLVCLLGFPWNANAAVAGRDRSQMMWQYYRTAEEAGFSSEGLEEARIFWEGLRPAAAAVFVVYKGKVLVDWGNTSYRFRCRSIRKSYLSALYGIHVAEGNIDLQATLAELNIDDDPLLTEAEKQAKVIYLLKSRSGVYHEAAAEAPEMRELRPERGSHAPDTFWYYNNWDFNALGTIFEQETGTGIFEEFKRRIADPIGMQDFSLGDCSYNYELEYSIHPSYPFRMSARDRARFGQLFIQEGRWGEQQIVPKWWVRESTRAHSDASLGLQELQGLGYGYMWWTIAPGMPALQEFEHLRNLSAYFASGYGGHEIDVLSEEDMVYVIVVNNDDQDLEIEYMDSQALLNMILAAKEFETIDLAITKLKNNPTSLAAGDELNIVTTVRNLSREASTPTTVQFYLSRDTRLRKKDRLIGSAQLRAVKRGKKRTVRLRTTLPENIKPGSYYLIAYVDEENLNYDPDETNNVFVSSRRITIR